MAQITVTTDSELLSATKDASARLGVSLSTFVRSAIRRYLDETDGDLMLVLDDPELRPIVQAETKRQRALELMEELR